MHPPAVVPGRQLFARDQLVVPEEQHLATGQRTPRGNGSGTALAMQTFDKHGDGSKAYFRLARALGLWG